MKYKLACAVFFLACVILYTKFGGDAKEQPSFSNTGLLAHSAESAEEILIRAHNMDLDAIVLTVAGYSLGLGGFPEIYAVGSAWAEVSARIAAPEDVALLSAINNFWSDEAEHSPVLLADCDLALKSRYAELLEQAGIFSLATRLEELAPLRSNSAEWLQKYQSRQAKLKQQNEYFSQMRSFVAELSKRAVTHKEVLRLRDYMANHSGALIYFSGTEQTIGNGQVKWSAARCLEFIGMRSGDQLDGSIAAPSYWFFWYALGDSFTDSSASLRDLIRRAHTGDMNARRSIAQYYITWGSPGNYFILDPGLSVAWMLANNNLKDEKSYLQTAIYTYENKDIATSWALASQASDIATGEEQETAKVLLRLLEAEPHFNRDQAEEHKQRYFDKLPE